MNLAFIARNRYQESLFGYLIFSYLILLMSDTGNDVLTRLLFAILFYHYFLQ